MKMRNLKKLSLASGAIVAAAALTVWPIGNSFAGALTSGEAFGSPGASPTWSASTTNVLGTAENTTSTVWFTGNNGILGEIFYPSADTPATVDWEFMVGDSNHTWVDEEKKNTTSSVTMNNSKALSWNVTNTATNGKYKISKTIFTDPTRNTVIQQVTFTALSGTLGNYNLYTLFHPALDNNGQATTGSTASYNGYQMLVAKNNSSGHASAMASSLPFVSGMMSSGFVGQSDGWQDLLGGSADHTMNWTYDSATNGNVAQMAEFDLSPYANQTSVTFNLVLGFGTNTTNAETAASGTLGDNFTNMLSTYNSQWNTYANSLNTQGGTADEQYYVAAMSLKAAQDKASGAMVAGLGNPWGNSNYSQGGYHLVWPRDLYKFASALITAGDTTTANSALTWLFNTMQQSDGHFPQNAFVNGTPYWNGIQMDETAFPIMLAWKLGRTDSTTYTNHIKPAADYLVKNGPWTQEERWEENGGYSPSTIAAEIAGLVCAADIAGKNGDTVSQSRYLAKADYWQGLVEDWTYTTTGSLGGGQYYERIDDNANPNDGHTLTLGNGGGSWDERSIVDGGYLELVRNGVKSWNDPYIQSTLNVVDSTIKETIPGKGDAWFRYNHDGYGETSTGADYTGSGIGRLWPIFTGERGHYVVASGGDASSYLSTMRSFANSSYMIPEQVWDNNAPSGYTPGTPTKSMSPLNWAMGEYIDLLASQYNKKVMDQTSIVYSRYVSGAYQPHAGYTVDYNSANLQQGKALTIFYKGSVAGSAKVNLHWGYNNWTATTDKPMVKRSDGFWQTTISVPINATALNFCFTDGTNWDNNGGGNWNPSVTSNSYTAFATPVDLYPAPAVNGQPLNVYYKGTLASGASAMTLHWGYNNWTSTTDVPMTKQSDGSWMAQITVPSGSGLNFDFYNQSSTWDNNGGNNYNYTISQR